MTRILTPEEAEEYQRLQEEHSSAVAHAAEMAAQFGMDSPQFLEADNVTTSLWRRLRAFQGT